MGAAETRAVPLRRWHWIALLLALSWPAHSQQLEPRAYSPNPVGIHFITLNAGRTDGDVLTDAASPIQDFKVKVNESAIGYGQSFALADRMASFGIVVPSAAGEATGTLDGESRIVHRNGFADLRVRFTASLLKGSALDPAAFARQPPDRTLGVSLVVSAPTGEYFDDKLVNLGTNRWGFKPELGGARQFGRWTVDGTLGGWFYTKNPDFLLGPKEQDPIGVVQGHVSYTFAPRLWLGLGLTWYSGGQSTVGGVEQPDSLDNSRAGITLALPIGKQQSVKLAFSTGTSARAGGEYDNYAISWQFLWFD